MPALDAEVSMRRILIVSWYVIWPAAALLIGRTIYERACLGLTEPWPWLAGHPALSLVIGATYVCAHGWTMTWIAWTWGKTFTDPGARGPRVALGQGLAMLAILAIDYSPLTPWRWMMRALGC
jgi:hypothetical protein